MDGPSVRHSQRDELARYAGRKAFYVGDRHCRAHRRAERTSVGRFRLPPRAGETLGPGRCDRADHGRAAGRQHVGRGLRDIEPGALAGARCRGPDPRRLSAGDLLARHRPAAGSRLGFFARAGARGKSRDARAGRRPQTLSRSSRRPRGRRDRDADQAAPHRRQAGRKSGRLAEAQGDGRSHARPDGRFDPLVFARVKAGRGTGCGGCGGAAAARPGRFARPKEPAAKPAGKPANKKSKPKKT